MFFLRNIFSCYTIKQFIVAHMFRFLRKQVVFITVSTSFWGKKLQRCLQGLFLFLVVCHWLAFICFGDLIGSSLVMRATSRRRRIPTTSPSPVRTSVQSGPRNDARGGAVAGALPKRRRVTPSSGRVEALRPENQVSALPAPRRCVFCAVSRLFCLVFKVLRSAQTFPALR